MYSDGISEEYTPDTGASLKKKKSQFGNRDGKKREGHTHEFRAEKVFLNTKCAIQRGEIPDDHR